MTGKTTILSISKISHSWRSERILKNNHFLIIEHWAVTVGWHSFANVSITSLQQPLSQKTGQLHKTSHTWCWQSQSTCKRNNSGTGVKLNIFNILLEDLFKNFWRNSPPLPIHLSSTLCNLIQSLLQPLTPGTCNVKQQLGPNIGLINCKTHVRRRAMFRIWTNM